MTGVMIKLLAWCAFWISVSVGCNASEVAGQARLASREAYDVKQAGAKGDGLANDTAAIQRTIDAAPDGSTIYFPAGTYAVTNLQVHDRSGLSFVGEGRQSTIRQQAGAARIATFMRSRDITIRHLAFDANGIASYGGVVFYDAQAVRIENNFFFDGAPKPIGRTDRYSFVFARGGTPSQDIQILDNHIEDLQVEVDHARRVTIEGNTVKRPVKTAGIGIFTITDGAVAEDFEITNNTVIDPLGSGFSVVIDPPTNGSCIFRRITIANNHIVQSRHQSYGIRIGTGNNSRATSGNIFDDIVVKNNRIRVEATAPRPNALIFANSSQRAGIVFDRLVVSGNTIENHATTQHGYAIDLRQITNSLIADNTVKGVVHGISLNGGLLHNRIDNNVVEASQVAYSLRGSLGGNRAANNRIVGNPRQGWAASNLAASDIVEK